MREEYDRVLSTHTMADKTGRFGQYRYISKTQYRRFADASVYL